MRVWDLPGGQRFIDDIRDDLKIHNSVVAHFRFGIPDGFDSAIEIAIGDGFTVKSIQADSSPLETLANRFASELKSDYSITDLLRDSAFNGLLIRIRITEASYWIHWREFLTQYADRSRARPYLERCVFLVTIEGDHDRSPAREAGLANYYWDHALDEFDFLFFSNECLRSRGHPATLRSLLAYTITYIAGKDFHTVELLVGESTRTILEPWEHSLNKTRDAGMASEQSNSNTNGSALAITHRSQGNSSSSEMRAQLEQRIWRAQLTVLQPWIELQRQAIVDRNLEEVKRLMRAVGDADIDPFSLEIGELFEYFTHRLATKRIRRAVHSLRHARNKLAHRNAMSYDEITDLLSNAVFSVD